MVKTAAQMKLKTFRATRGLTLERAGSLVVVDGKPVDRATWYGWEAKGKRPKPPWMLELERLGVAEPNDFYRPDAGELPSSPQLALL